MVDASGPDAGVVLPILGQVYWVLSWIFIDNDKKERRPVVVVRAPRWENDIVVVMERTSSRTDLRGVAHPPNSKLGLNRPGLWANRFTRHVEERLFRPPSVELMGTLDQPYLEQVLKMWEEG